MQIQFIILICTIGCLIQLFQIINSYLDWNITSQVTVSFSNSIEIPDLTLCVHFLYTINFTSFILNYPDKIPQKCRNFSEPEQVRLCFVQNGGQWPFQRFVGKNFLVDQFYNDLVYKPDETFIKVIIWARERQFGDHLSDGNCNITIHIKDPQVCYTVSCGKNGPIYLTKNELNMAPHIGSMMGIQINQKIFQFWEHSFLYLHTPRTLPRGFESDYTVLSQRSKPTLYFVNFKKIVVNLLPAPYKTNCFDYSKLNAKSRLEYFESCLNKAAKLKFNSVFYGTFINPNQSISFANHVQKERSEDYINIEAKCGRKIARPECHSKWYIPFQKGYEDLKTNFSYIIISAPTEPDLIKTTESVFTFYKLIIYVGSILGTWFGFNVVSHIGYSSYKLWKLLGRSGQNKLGKRLSTERFKRMSKQKSGLRRPTLKIWSTLSGTNKISP